MEIANYKASCEDYERRMREYAHKQTQDEEIRKNAVCFLENECERITALLEQSQNRLDKIYENNTNISTTTEIASAIWGSTSLL